MANNRESPKGTRKALSIALITIIVLVLAWHLFFPMMGIAIAVGTLAWGVIVGTIVFLSISVLLFFLFSSLGILILSLFALVWVVFALTLFPFTFPLLMPLLVIVLFVAYIRRKSAPK